MGYRYRYGYGETKPPYTAQARALFGRMSTQPSRTVKTAANELIKTLLSLDAWDRFDLLCLPLIADDAEGCTRNWVEDDNNLTTVNSPTLLGVGWTSDGSTSYLDSGLAENAAANFSQNDAYVAAISLSDLASDSYLDVGASARMYINARNASGNAMVSRMNFSSSTSGPQIQSFGGNGIGIFSVNRQSSTSFDMSRNAATPVTKTVGTEAVSGATFTMCRVGASYSLRANAGMIVGRSVSDQQAVDAAIMQYFIDAFEVDLDP